MGCLTCVAVCPDHVFSAEPGILHTTSGSIPVVLRQSDRVRGELAAVLLRNRIKAGCWKLGGMY